MVEMKPVRLVVFIIMTKCKETSVYNNDKMQRDKLFNYETSKTSSVYNKDQNAKGQVVQL